jgi:DNA-directed RNA polymerase specialized sigma24 family protein
MANNHPPTVHPLASRSIARYLRAILRRGGVPGREMLDCVQTVLCKTLAAAAPGTEKPEQWTALAAKIAADEAVEYARKRTTVRRYSPGLTGKPDAFAAEDNRIERTVEAKQQIGCVRQVIEQDGVHPLASQVVEGQALGLSREEIGEKLGIAEQTVTNIASGTRRAFTWRWAHEKISWAIAWFIMIVVGLPALVAHLHAKRDEADTSRKKEDAPAVSQEVQASWQKQKAEKLRNDAMRLCDQGEYVDCLVALNEARELDPEGDEVAEVREARRIGVEGLRRQHKEAEPSGQGRKLAP